MEEILYHLIDKNGKPYGLLTQRKMGSHNMCVSYSETEEPVYQRCGMRIRAMQFGQDRQICAGLYPGVWGETCRGSGLSADSGSAKDVKISFGYPRCRYAATPATNREFWLEKFDQNVTRDWNVQEQLRAMGWNVIVVWECEESK